jgi:hypothetical protein
MDKLRELFDAKAFSTVFSAATTKRGSVATKVQSRTRKGSEGVVGSGNGDAIAGSRADRTAVASQEGRGHDRVGRET